MRIEPANIQIVGNELAIAWSDCAETFLPLETLRRACPCAACGGEPDVLGRVERPRVSCDERSFALRGWHIVGGYAWQPVWQDGHATGLYSFEYLRRLGSSSAKFSG